MANGIIIIDKPAEWTSMDVCAKLRGIFHEKRVGHGGTLDPMATGVLPVFVGRATRAVELATQSVKEYLFGIRLGVVTNTQDVTGQVLERRPASVPRDRLDAALEQFWGDIRQVPPMYSAIKIGGKKLYELARKGQEVERPARSIYIYALNVVDRPPPAGSDYLLRVVCSKGTYVRTLCHDIGQALGCGGCMSYLRRVGACGFTESDALPLEAVQAAAGRGEADALLLPVDRMFLEYPAAEIAGRALFRAKNGGDFPWEGPNGYYRVYGPGGEFLLLGSAVGGVMTTVKSFFEV